MEKLADDDDLQFHNAKLCTYDKKLKQLDQFEEALIKEDKAMKMNRRSISTICRMQGSLSQSYFLFDSQKFTHARNIYYELMDEGTNYKQLGIHPDKPEEEKNFIGDVFFNPNLNFGLPKFGASPEKETLEKAKTKNEKLLHQQLHLKNVGGSIVKEKCADPMKK